MRAPRRPRRRRGARACTAGVEQARFRPRLPEAADARAEKAADLAPARGDDRSRRRQPGPDVELPERPPRSAREAELEHGDRAAGPYDTNELAQRRRHVVDVAEEVREREGVELRVGERQGLGSSLAQLDPVAEPAALDPVAAGREHLQALVDADDGPARLGQRELDRDRRRAAGDVEHAGGVPGDPGDEERAPARVLAEGKQPRVPVVRRPERREQIARVARAGGGLHAPILHP